jgi:flagellar basal body-associated protein FliL
MGKKRKRIAIVIIIIIIIIIVVVAAVAVLSMMIIMTFIRRLSLSLTGAIDDVISMSKQHPQTPANNNNKKFSVR